MVAAGWPKIEVWVRGNCFSAPKLTHLQAVVGTILTPLDIFVMELAPNSDSGLGIGAATPTPLEWNSGIPGDSNIHFEIR